MPKLTPVVVLVVLLAFVVAAMLGVMVAVADGTGCVPMPTGVVC